MDPGWTGFNFFLEWLTYRFSDSLQHGNSSKEADFFTTLERKLFFKIRGLCLSSPFYFYSIPKSTFTPPKQSRDGKMPSSSVGPKLSLRCCSFTSPHLYLQSISRAGTKPLAEW